MKETPDFSFRFETWVPSHWLFFCFFIYYVGFFLFFSLEGASFVFLLTLLHKFGFSFPLLFLSLLGPWRLGLGNCGDEERGWEERGKGQGGEGGLETCRKQGGPGEGNCGKSRQANNTKLK